MPSLHKARTLPHLLLCDLPFSMIPSSETAQSPVLAALSGVGSGQCAGYGTLIHKLLPPYSTACWLRNKQDQAAWALQ